jgi:hypothetical protein
MLEQLTADELVRLNGLLFVRDVGAGLEAGNPVGFGRKGHRREGGKITN